MAKVDKWEILKLWVGQRHDHLEKQYKETNFSADAAELGALRGVYQTMSDLDDRERRQSIAAQVKSADPTRKVK